MEEVEIRCFQHCDREKNILCFTVPLMCPLCGADLTQSGLRIPPYLLNSPFTDASYTQQCLVIKPTEGNFLHDFNNDSNLHVGLTDSIGRVYEFDERGVTIGGGNWTRCLSVNMLEEGDDLTSMWDQGLEQFSCNPHWKAELYNEDAYNCYDFVLHFLRQTCLDRKYPFLVDRALFCEQTIIPATKRAGKYISLYREIKTHSVVIQTAGHLV